MIPFGLCRLWTITALQVQYVSHVTQYGSSIAILEQHVKPWSQITNTAGTLNHSATSFNMPNVLLAKTSIMAITGLASGVKSILAITGLVLGVKLWLSKYDIAGRDTVTLYRLEQPERYLCNTSFQPCCSVRLVVTKTECVGHHQPTRPSRFIFIYGRPPSPPPAPQAMI